MFDSKGVTDNLLVCICRSIAKLFSNHTNIVHVDFNPCRQQRNDIDCGLFAIANLFNIRSQQHRKWCHACVRI